MAFDVVCVASWNADLVSRVPRPIARGETLPARSFDILPGGKGSNAAIACARQGARVALIARVGDDAFAAVFGNQGDLFFGILCLPGLQYGRDSVFDRLAGARVDDLEDFVQMSAERLLVLPAAKGFGNFID